MTQEIEVWDDTAETSTKDSVETEAPDGAVAAAEVASPATVEGTPFSRGEDVPPSDADFVPVFDATTYLPVFDPEAPHVTHVSVVGHHHLQRGHLFSIGTKVHVASLQEIQ